MILKKPTKQQYNSLFGTLADQIKVVLTLAFEDDGALMFADEESASYRKFCEVVDALKKMTEDDVNSEAFVTKGLTLIDIFVREVEQLFAVKDQDERFAQLEKMVRAKLRLDGRSLTDEEYDNLPYSDQIVAVNKTIKDVTGESKSPLAKSAKE
jgi:hypothetical protein